MKIIKHPLFYCSVLLACLLYIGQRLQLPLPNWVYFYANDFLCMPVVLSFCLAALRIIKKDETIYVPIGIIIALTSYFAVYFEWFMPQMNSRYTGDIIDIVLYFFGAILFYALQKKLF